jgi:hypothetical protein
MSIPVSNAYVEMLFSLMTCYWLKEQNKCSENFVKAEILVKMSNKISFRSSKRRDFDAVLSTAKYSFQNRTNKYPGVKKR